MHFLLALATFQVLSSHMRLVAITSENKDETFLWWWEVLLGITGLEGERSGEWLRQVEGKMVRGNRVKELRGHGGEGLYTWLWNHWELWEK